LQTARRTLDPRLSETRRACLASGETSEAPHVRFRILGSVEAEVGDSSLQLGGGKQLAVLAALLLRAGEVVPLERLVDEVWGEDPPPSAAHSLEAYVSRLRQSLVPHGVALERRGGGYRIELGDAVLDAHLLEALVGDASRASAAGDAERAAALATEALALWRGPVLGGVQLHLDGEAESERLEELRLRAIEIRVDADLAIGRHQELVGELRRLIHEHPYRERLVAQLMVALYRSGRQADALTTYESMRRRLMDELGIQPSPEVQRLSGEIVRQEAKLSLPVAPVEASRGTRSRRRGAVLGLAFAVAALPAVAVALVLGGVGGGGDAAATGTRVALILPRASEAGREDTFVTPFVDGLRRVANDYGVETKTFVLDQWHPQAAALERVGRSLRTGRFDLVLVAGLGPSGFALLPIVSRLPAVRFVYLDASLEGTPVEWHLKWPRNTTGLPFADADSGYLAGYLSGLMSGRKSPFLSRNPMISVVGGPPVPTVTTLVRSFVRGARKALPGVAIRVDYADSFTDQTICERIANRQIDRGSTVVFAAAGTCGLGALAAAGVRGVWGVGGDADRSYLGAHILASTVKRNDRAVELAVRWFLEGTLPAGDVVLGLDDDAVGIAGISPEVPPTIRKRIARIEASLRAAEAAPHS
jgi:DNA-binding SARP family transcriptional activator/basic membrane lipoprotein Med (substrate-binding protein (PBP1-ABC) superfamily)